MGSLIVKALNPESKITPSIENKHRRLAFGGLPKKGLVAHLRLCRNEIHQAEDVLGLENIWPVHLNIRLKHEKAP
jgi:hypothetical protein